MIEADTHDSYRNTYFRIYIQSKYIVVRVSVILTGDKSVLTCAIRPIQRIIRA